MKHAFIIMAHNNYSLLGRLLKKLDHPDHAIYLHIDAKAVFTEEDMNALKQCCKYANIHMAERYSIIWGGYSMINGLLRLFETALKGKHDYYHYLSGACFPIKPIETIHNFFEQYNGCEFLHFCSDDFTEQQKGRFCQYHFLQEKVGRNKSALAFIERVLLFVQRKILKIDRSKKFPEIIQKSGSCWCSLTHDCVAHLLSQEPLIKKMYSYSVCCDEHYLQTIIYNSPFQKNIYCFKYSIDEKHANLRSIDWERSDPATASPYTFDVNDYDMLVASNNLFCRKVDTQTPEGNALIEKLEQL